jgi:hypothetical protein
MSRTDAYLAHDRVLYHLLATLRNAADLAEVDQYLAVDERRHFGTYPCSAPRPSKETSR